MTVNYALNSAPQDNRYAFGRLPEFNSPAARFSARPNLIVRPRRFLHRHARRDHSFYDFEFVHTYLRPQYAQNDTKLFDE